MVCCLLFVVCVLLGVCVVCCWVAVCFVARIVVRRCLLLCVGVCCWLFLAVDCYSLFDVFC